MEKLPPSSSSSNVHLIDIPDLISSDDRGTSKAATNKAEKRARQKPVRFQEQPRGRPANRGFSRQVSLETGFSVLKGKENERPTLARSGRSLGGGFGSSSRVVGEGKKGDFDMFRTKSTLTKQNSFMPSRKETNEVDYNQRHVDGSEAGDDSVNRSVPAGRYFAALKGPELDQVKDYEDILLPKDEIWPFLLRFPIGCFGIPLGLSSQAILWKALATSPAMKFFHITPYINLVIWTLAMLILFLVSSTYLLKCIFYFEAIKREYFHPVRVNFFFAPWIVCMFMTVGAPPKIASDTIHPAIFCVFMAPIFLLELKIYGQWLSGGKRRLSMVGNPSSHLAVIGNFVGAILAAKAGWKEPAKFLWAVGFAHYLVVFVTLYQRLPTSEALPKELHPVYSMFISTPSAASIAWDTIYGGFDNLSRTCYFIALFLYISLVVRINFFRGFRFSIAWWSYTFPMTTASIATIKYAEQVPSMISKGLALGLSLMSSTMVAILFISTLLHAFVWKTLFPNDLAIAIKKRKLAKDKNKKPTKRSYDIRRWTKQAPLSLVSALTRNNS